MGKPPLPPGSVSFCVGFFVQVAIGAGFDGCFVIDANGYGLGGSFKIGGGPSAGVGVTGGAQYSNVNIEETGNGGACQPFGEASGGEGIIVGAGGQPPSDGSWSIGVFGGIGLVFTPPALSADFLGGMQCSEAFYLGKW